MKGDIFLLHGFNVRDGGKNTVGRLLPYLPNSRVINYGWVGFLGTIFFNDNIAKMVKSQLTHDCTVIGHSNAADIIHRALLLNDCPRIKRLVLVRPALDGDVSFGDNVERVDVFHHKDDAPVGLAKYIPFHKWGSMGEHGYSGDDKNVVNHDEEEIFDDTKGGHSAPFQESLSFFVPYLKGVLA